MLLKGLKRHLRLTGVEGGEGQCYCPPCVWCGRQRREGMRRVLVGACVCVCGVERVSTTHDGKIACYMKPTPGSSSSNSSGSSETKYIESPDDLFKIGISDVDYTSLGLQHFIVA
ncbi:hypothetical protein ACOMHN_018726 [Nucella lapillus]